MKLSWVLFLFLFISSSNEPAKAKEEMMTSLAPVFTAQPTHISFANFGYAIQGFIITAGNLLIVLAVATTKELWRKELIIITGLALAEFILGIGFLTAGIRRGWLEVSGYNNQPSTQWHCMWVIHTPFWLAAMFPASVMLVITSLDRLLAIKAPLWYWQQTNRYAYICLSLAYCPMVVSEIVGIIAAYYIPEDSTVVLLCLFSMAVPIWLVKINYLMLTLCGWTSVVIYVLVIYFYREQGKRLPSEQLKERHLMRQRRMTRTIGICVLITLCTVCIGHMAKLVMYWSKGGDIHPPFRNHLEPLLSIFINLNIMANVFVYSWCQKDIWAAIIRILTFGQVKLSPDVPAHGQEQCNVRMEPQNLQSDETSVRSGLL